MAIPQFVDSSIRQCPELLPRSAAGRIVAELLGHRGVAGLARGAERQHPRHVALAADRIAEDLVVHVPPLRREPRVLEQALPHPLGVSRVVLGVGVESLQEGDGDHQMTAGAEDAVHLLDDGGLVGIVMERVTAHPIWDHGSGAGVARRVVPSRPRGLRDGHELYRGRDNLFEKSIRQGVALAFGCETDGR